MASVKNSEVVSDPFHLVTGRSVGQMVESSICLVSKWRWQQLGRKAEASRWLKSGPAPHMLEGPHC